VPRITIALRRPGGAALCLLVANLLMWSIFL